VREVETDLFPWPMSVEDPQPCTFRELALKRLATSKTGGATSSFPEESLVRRTDVTDTTLQARVCTRALLSGAYDLHVISVAGWYVYCGFRVDRILKTLLRHASPA